MMIESITSALKAHKKEIEYGLLTNAVKDFDEYRYVTGRLRGLEDALQLLKETCRGYN